MKSVWLTILTNIYNSGKEIMGLGVLNNAKLAGKQKRRPT